MSRASLQGAGDLYAVLEVSPSATLAEIKAAYRSLVKKLHPDVNPDASEASLDRFKDVTAAYSVLSNESSRAEYDSQYAFKHGSGPTGAGSGYTVYRGFDGYDRARKAPRTDPTMTAKMTPDEGEDASQYFDAQAWHRAHYGATPQEQAQAVRDAMNDTQAGSWRLNYARRQRARAAGTTYRQTFAERVQTTYHAAPKPVRSTGGRLGPGLLLAGVAVGLVLFDQVSRRMRAHEYASMRADRVAASPTPATPAPSATPQPEPRV